MISSIIGQIYKVTRQDVHIKNWRMIRVVRSISTHPLITCNGHWAIHLSSIYTQQTWSKYISRSISNNDEHSQEHPSIHIKTIHPGHMLWKSASRSRFTHPYRLLVSWETELPPHGFFHWITYLPTQFMLA